MIWQKIIESTDYLQKKIPKGFTPKVGLILGSGLGQYTKNISDSVTIPYSDIPNFLTTTIEGHEGKLVFGKINGVNVMAMQGRVHPYEGHDIQITTMPVRVMKRLGCEYLFVTNAAGTVNPNFRPGSLVIISDHINFTGKNALVGENLSELGPRFPDMTESYNLKLRNLLSETANEMKLTLPSGIYAGFLGPSYETPAEIRMMRIVGADLVGMSTIQEVIVANHCGLKVAGISCVTNLAAGISKEKLTHDEVKREANNAANNLSQLLSLTIQKLK